MSRLFKTVVERKRLNDGHGEVLFQDVRAYVVVAEDEEEARKMTPLCRNEYVRVVQEQVKSPYVYLLPKGA
jgi:hypothetical protein